MSHEAVLYCVYPQIASNCQQYPKKCQQYPEYPQFQAFWFRLSLRSAFVQPSSTHRRINMACTCHRFLYNGQCVSTEDSQCVSFPSLICYNHLDVVPVPRKPLAMLWKRAFPKFKMSVDYPIHVMLCDLFRDTSSRPFHEASLELLFEKYPVA
jgi:hypothetical protein